VKLNSLTFLYVKAKTQLPYRVRSHDRKVTIIFDNFFGFPGHCPGCTNDKTLTFGRNSNVVVHLNIGTLFLLSSGEIILKSRSYEI
jgi:hypothetical protein